MEAEEIRTNPAGVIISRRGMLFAIAPRRHRESPRGHSSLQILYRAGLVALEILAVAGNPESEAGPAEGAD